MEDNMNQVNITPEQDNDNKSNTFNIIIGVSTLLIAILGATFAYFTANASSNENDVTVQSAYVSISYDGGTEIKASNLIPSTEAIALNYYQKEAVLSDDGSVVDEDDYTNSLDRRCIDANGREVCYVYQFTIESDGEEGGTTSIAGAVKINTNEFTNLSYTLYEVSLDTDTDGNTYKDKYGFYVVSSYTGLNFFNNVEDENNSSIPNYATFEKPFDNYGTDGQYLSTTYPLACLFGFSSTYDSEDADDLARCDTITISNNVPHTYQLVIWLEETGSVQYEQGLVFEGTVTLEVPTTGNDTGTYSDGKITGQ